MITDLTGPVLIFFDLTKSVIIFLFFLQKNVFFARIKFVMEKIPFAEYFMYDYSYRFFFFSNRHRRDISFLRTIQQPMHRGQHRRTSLPTSVVV